MVEEHKTSLYYALLMMVNFKISVSARNRNKNKNRENRSSPSHGAYMCAFQIVYGVEVSQGMHLWVQGFHNHGPPLILLSFSIKIMDISHSQVALYGGHDLMDSHFNVLYWSYLFLLLLQHKRGKHIFFSVCYKGLCKKKFWEGYKS